MVFKKASINKKRSHSEPSSNPSASETSFTQHTLVKCTSSQEIRPGRSLEIDITISFEKRCVKGAISDIHIESLVESFQEIIQWSVDIDHDIGIISSRTYVTISPLIHQQSFQNSDKYETQEKSHSTQEDTIKDVVSKPDSKNQVGSIQNLPEAEQQEQLEFEQNISVSVEDEYRIMSSEVVGRNDSKEDSAVESTNLVQLSDIKSPLVSGVSELTEVINMESKVDDKDFTAMGLQTVNKNEVCEDLKLNSETHEDYDDDQQQQQQQQRKEQSQQILSTSESAENLEHESVVNNEIQATYTPQSVSSDLKGGGTNKTVDEAINDYSSSKEKSQLSRQETSVSHQKLDGENEILNEAGTVAPNEIKDKAAEFISNKDTQESSPSHVPKTFEVNDSVKPIQSPQQIQVSDQNSEYKLKSDNDLQLHSSTHTTPYAQPYFENKTEAFNQFVEAQEESVAVYSGSIVFHSTSVISFTITDRKPGDVDMKFTESSKEWNILAVDSIQSVVLDSCQINSQIPIKPITHSDSYAEISPKLPNNQLQTVTTPETCPPTDDDVAQIDDTEDRCLKHKEQPSTHEDVIQQQYKDNEEEIHTKEDVLNEKLSFREPTATPVKNAEFETEISEPHEKIVYGAGMSEKDESDRELGEKTDKDNTHKEEFTSKQEYTIINKDESSRHDQPHLVIEQKCSSLISISLDLPKKAMLPTIISTDSFAVPDITQAPPTFAEQRTHQNIETDSTHLAESEKSSNLRCNLTTDQLPENQEVSYLPVGSELEISKFTQLSIHGQTTKATEPIDVETIVSKNELQPIIEQNVVSSSNKLNQSEIPMVAEQTDTSKQLESMESEDKAEDIEMQKADQVDLKNEENNLLKIPTSNKSSCNQPSALVIATTCYKEVDSTDVRSERPIKKIQLFTVQSHVETSESTQHFQNISTFKYSESRQSVDMDKAEGKRNDEKCDDDGVDVSVDEDYELPNKEVNIEPLSSQFTPVNMPIQQMEAVDLMKITGDSHETELQKSIVPSESDILETTVQLEISVSIGKTDKTNSIESVFSTEKIMCNEQKRLTPVSLKSQEQEPTCKPTSIIPTETQLKPPKTLSGEFQVVTVPNVDTYSLKQESKSSFVSQNSQVSLDKYKFTTMSTVEQVVSKEQAETLATLKGTESTKSSELNPIRTTVKENVSDSGVKSHHPTPYDTAFKDTQSEDSMKTASSSLQKELNESVEQKKSVVHTSSNQTDDKSLVLNSKNTDSNQDSNLPIFSDHEGLLTVTAADKISEKAKFADTSMKVDKDDEENKLPENVSQHGTASILSAEMIKSSLITTASLFSVKWNTRTDPQILTDNNQLITKLSVQFSDENKLVDSIQVDESTKPEMTTNPAESSLNILYDDKSEIHQSLSLDVSTKQDSQSLSKNLQDGSTEKVRMNKKDPSKFVHQKVLGNSSLVFHTDQHETKAFPLEANEVSTSSRSRNQADYSSPWLKNIPDNNKPSPSPPNSQIQSTFPEICKSSNLKACCYCCQPSRVHLVCHCYCSQHHISSAFPNYCQTNTRAKSISCSNFLHCNCQMTPCTCDYTTTVNDDNQYIEPVTCSLKLQLVKPNSQECQTITYENPTDSNLKMQCLSKSNPTICRCVSPRTVYCCCSQISNSTISIYCNRNPHHRNTTPYLSASISQIIPGHQCCCNRRIPKKHECASHVHGHLKQPPNNFYWS
ncbi:unnamed protein product [Trichobilharzia szidati]|nr:unnamed protein product [Trichobilharzia szidati]